MSFLQGAELRCLSRRDQERRAVLREEVKMAFQTMSAEQTAREMEERAACARDQGPGGRNLLEWLGLVCLSACPSRLSCPSVCLYVCLSACPSRLSCPSVCLYVCLSRPSRLSVL